MILTKVGMQFIPGLGAQPEHTTYDYTPGGHTLTLCVSDPAREEIRAVQEQEAVFGLFLRENALFIFVIPSNARLC